MRVVTLDDIPHEDLGEATPIAGWAGGSVTRSRQTIIPAGASDNYNCSVVNFTNGSTTGWHVHIKAGEKHWHGAKADTTLSHITVTAVGSKATFL